MKVKPYGISLDDTDRARIELIRQQSGLRTKMDAIRQALRNEAKRLQSEQAKES